MLPRLKAEEAMEDATRVNVGMGSQSGAATFSRWQSIAQHTPVIRKGDPQTHLPPGFGVHLVPKAEASV